MSPRQSELQWVQDGASKAEGGEMNPIETKQSRKWFLKPASDIHDQEGATGTRWRVENRLCLNRKSQMHFMTQASNSAACADPGSATRNMFACFMILLKKLRKLQFNGPGLVIGIMRWL